MGSGKWKESNGVFLVNFWAPPLMEASSNTVGPFQVKGLNREEKVSILFSNHFPFAVIFPSVGCEASGKHQRLWLIYLWILCMMSMHQPCSLTFIALQIRYNGHDYLCVGPLLIIWSSSQNKFILFYQTYFKIQTFFIINTEDKEWMNARSFCFLSIGGLMYTLLAPIGHLPL